MTTTTSIFGQSVVESAKLGLMLTEALTKDIPAEQFASLICNDGKKTVANHPAYAIGHLAIYPSKVAHILGEDASKYACPDKWDELFEQNVDCLDDPDCSIYPGKDEILKSFETGYRSALELIANADDSVFAAENPIEGIRDRLPTIGSMCLFLMTSHVMFHLGQVSTWRRCNGLGSAM